MEEILRVSKEMVRCFWECREAEGNSPEAAGKLAAVKDAEPIDLLEDYKSLRDILDQTIKQAEEAGKDE